jgi:hypothetical protein
MHWKTTVRCAIAAAGIALALQIQHAYAAGTEVLDAVPHRSECAEEASLASGDGAAAVVEEPQGTEPGRTDVSAQVPGSDRVIDQAPTPRPPSIQAPPERSCIDHPAARYKRALVRLLAEVARAVTY